jgi:hypothetical protein
MRGHEPKSLGFPANPVCVHASKGETAVELLDLDDIFDDDRIRVPRTPGLTPDDLPAEWRDMYRESAAIREVSGDCPANSPNITLSSTRSN